jgi:hypothetical protein
MGKRLGGVVGIYLDDHELVKACHRVREAGYKKFDAFTPFPVHGIEEAIGISRSMIPWVTFIAGVTGGVLGMLLQYWISAVDWALNVGGRPFFSGPAFMPVTFEMTILFAALFSVGAMIALCGLPKIDPPLIDKDITSHKFAIFIPENEDGFNAAAAEQLLRTLGATEVRRIADFA